MFLDILCGAALLGFIVAGSWYGVMAGLVRLGIAVFAFFVGKAAGPALAGLMDPAVGTMKDIAAAVAAFGATVLVYVVSSVGMSVIAPQFLDNTDGGSTVGRLGVGLLSAVRGAFVVFVVISGLVWANTYLARMAPFFWVDTDASWVGRKARTHNVFLREQFPRQFALERLVQEIDRGEWTSEASRGSMEFQVLSADEAAFLFDPVVARAIGRGDWQIVADDGRFMNFLANSSIRRSLDGLSTGVIEIVDQEEEGPRFMGGRPQEE